MGEPVSATAARTETETVTTEQGKTAEGEDDVRVIKRTIVKTTPLETLLARRQEKTRQRAELAGMIGSAVNSGRSNVWGVGFCLAFGMHLALYGPRQLNIHDGIEAFLPFLEPFLWSLLSWLRVGFLLVGHSG
jgi:hypothetical protein